VKILKIEAIIKLHEKIIQKTGGSSGIRDIGLLESALNRSLQTFGGEDLYPDILDKISTTTYSFINNHPMIDGNKRLGVMVMWILLKLNNIVFFARTF
jgi:death-on-curing protein